MIKWIPSLIGLLYCQVISTIKDCLFQHSTLSAAVYTSSELIGTKVANRPSYLYQNESLIFFLSKSVLIYMVYNVNHCCMHISDFRGVLVEVYGNCK